MRTKNFTLSVVFLFGLFAFASIENLHGSPIVIEAESFNNKDASVLNQGTYLSNFAPWRWASYANISIPHAGTYLVEYRVASAGGGLLNLEQGGTSNIFGSVFIPNTGGVGQWEIISDTVVLPGGNLNFGIKGMGDNWNAWSLDWFRFSSINAVFVAPNDNPRPYMISVYPVPAYSHEIKFDFSLGRSSYVRLSVFDLRGKEIQVVFESYLEVGTYSKRLSAELNPGVYFLHLATGTDQKAVRFIIQ